MHRGAIVDKNLILNGLTADDYFGHLMQTMKNKITKWDYFVNWSKVLKNIKPYEKELCLLDCLIGQEDVKSELVKLIDEYPKVVKVLPLLLAIRETSVDVLIDAQNFIYLNFDFTTQKLSRKKTEELAEWFMQCGIGALVSSRKIRSFLSYATGVEVGLDSNARKNRTGTMMESIVEPFIASAALKQGGIYMAQATKAKIKAEWHIDIAVDKTDRRIDFAVKIESRLYFMETNFYGGGGSKLKSTAGEYKEMTTFWADNSHVDSNGKKYKSEFIWITDGAGWHSAKAPLREFFDRSPALLNLQCLQDGALERILK